MAIETFGATAAMVATYLGNRLPDGINTASVPTADEVADPMTPWSAVDVAKAIRAAGSTPSVVAAATTSEAYANCQELVVRGIAWRALMAAGSTEAADTEREDLEMILDGADEDPQSILLDLYDPGTNGGVPAADTTASDYDNRTTPQYRRDATQPYAISDQI